MQKKNNFVKKIILILTGIALLSAGCGGSSGGTSASHVVLKMWDPFINSQDIQPLITAYQQKHTNVEIQFTKKNYATYQQDLIDALASGNGPDIYAIHNDWLPQYIDKATSAPSTVFTYKDFKDAFVDVVTKDFTLNQKVYGVALSVDSLALYYNKDLMGTSGIATPPKTWSEFASDVQSIKRSDGRGYFTRSGAALGTNSNVNRAVDILYLFMLQQGAVPAGADGSPSFNKNIDQNGNSVNPASEALSFYTSFATPSSPNYNWNARSDYSIDAFVNGRAAFLYSYSYTRQTIMQKSPNLNFDVAPVPQPNLDNPSVNFANYWGEIVSKQTKAPNTSWDFLKFLTAKDSLDKYYAQVKQPSSRKDLIQLQIQDPDIGVFANANLTAKSFYKPDQEKMDNIFGQAIDNVILSGVSVQDSLNQAGQQADAISRAQ